MLYPCIHSDTRTDCLECLQTTIDFLDKEKKRILDARALAASEEHGYREGEAVMPFIDGRSFHCQCRCNVFYMHFDQNMDEWLYVCNACGLEYKGVKKSA